MDLINNSIPIKTELNHKNNSIKDNKNDILNLINLTDFENLNEYYDLESSIFMKRIEKLNLKFFWTSESLLNQKEIIYPYNKLFLILFKQISLYVEEIARLNKQLQIKNKNEKYMTMKLTKLKEKEKENILNKQMIKNLQRSKILLEKKDEKNKKEIEKLNKRIFKNINSGSNTLTNSLLLNNKNKNKNNFFYTSPKNLNVSTGGDTIITHGSALSKKSIKENKPKRMRQISHDIDETLIEDKNTIINKNIIQCEEELENLEIIEDFLINLKNKNSKIFKEVNSVRNTFSKKVTNKKLNSETNNNKRYSNKYNKNNDFFND